MLVRNSSSSSHTGPPESSPENSDGRRSSRYPSRRRKSGNENAAVFRPRESAGYDDVNHHQAPTPAFSRTSSGSHSSQASSAQTSSGSNGNIVPLFHRYPPPQVPSHGSMYFHPPHFHPASYLVPSMPTLSSESTYHPPYHPGYPYHHFPAYQHPPHAYSWPVGPPVEYITDIQPEDVLCGRGGATNSHSGNRAFRSLVKKYQAKYLKAKKRDKPAVASIIVEEIREKQGRFLRRADTSPQGEVRWVDIGDERAREKTCQALREGAPELRRKQSIGSAHRDGDEVSKEHESKEEERNPKAESRSSGVQDDHFRDDDSASTEVWGSKRTRVLRMNEKEAATETNHAVGKSLLLNEPSMIIRPCPRLLCQNVPICISLDELEAEERDRYLHDFLPPDPSVDYHAQNNPSHEIGNKTEHEDDREGSWSVVKV